MKANDKIYVSEFLKDLNKKVDEAISYHHVKKDYILKLSCKDLAVRCDVTAATISNLNTSSKFYLLYKIADEIYDCYYSYYNYEYELEKKNYPDEDIFLRDRNYVLMCLTTYYTDEWLNM